MIYKILKDCEGCPDGIHNKAYKEGEVYRIPQGLADVFLAEGWAEKVEEEKPKPKKKAAPKKKKTVKKEKKVVEFEEDK